MHQFLANILSNKLGDPRWKVFLHILILEKEHIDIILMSPTQNMIKVVSKMKLSYTFHELLKELIPFINYIVGTKMIPKDNQTKAGNNQSPGLFLAVKLLPNFI